MGKNEAEIQFSQSVVECCKICLKDNTAHVWERKQSHAFYYNNNWQNYDAWVLINNSPKLLLLKTKSFLNNDAISETAIAERFSLVNLGTKDYFYLIDQEQTTDNRTYLLLSDLGCYFLGFLFTLTLISHNLVFSCSSFSWFVWFLFGLCLFDKRKVKFWPCTVSSKLRFTNWSLFIESRNVFAFGVSIVEILSAVDWAI